MTAHRAIQHSSLEEEFLHHVAEALKGDHNNLRREQMILRAYRRAVSQGVMEVRLIPERVADTDFGKGFNAGLERALKALQDALLPVAEHKDPEPPA